MITPKVTDAKIVFGPCRLSFVHLFEKYNYGGKDEDGKYSTVVLIPKSEKETVAAIKRAIEAAKEQAQAGKWHGKKPLKMDYPLHDGDTEKEDEDFAGHYYLNAKCSTRPGVCDKNRQPITDEEEIYSGVWAYVSVTFFGFDTSGSKGVACGLNNVMKFKDGDRMGGRVSAEADFDGISIDDADDDDL